MHTFSGSIKFLLRESFLCQTMYFLSGRRICVPAFELESYVIPEKYLVPRSDRQSEKNIKGSLDDGTASYLTSQTNNPLLVDWDGPDDPLCPYNWSTLVKAITGIIMALSTGSLYMGASIITPAEDALEQQFGTSRIRVMLGMTLFVWGYGISSVWFSPMSESPLFGGRLYIFLGTQALFMILQIPTALSHHIAPFLILRLLAGLAASPPLSTGTAVYTDMIRFPEVTYGVITWCCGWIMGPYVGPLIGGALSLHNSWRWIFWYLLIQSGAVLLFMVMLLPETSEEALLMRKAACLRRRTGNPSIMAPGDIKKATQKPSQVLKYIFWNPVKLTVREPALVLMNIHMGLTYGIMYLYFEGVPVAYSKVYGFNVVQQGLGYLSILIGCAILYSSFFVYIRKVLVIPYSRGETPNEYHIFGNVAIVGSCLAPAALLIFGWASHPHVHWVVSMIGNAMYGASLELMFQSYLSLIAQLYPPSKVASAYASNNLTRSLLGGAFPLFGKGMFDNLAIDGYPVGWGCTLIAFIALSLIPLPVYLRQRGEHMHQRSIEKYGAS